MMIATIIGIMIFHLMLLRKNIMVFDQ
jgi:hypothetical protein